jgi:DNA polymerase-3 subunit alpha
MINWAKTNNIMVGPGRGSAAGSLVCYSLGITDVDPIEYDLLFFRFINPNVMTFQILIQILKIDVVKK